MPDTRAERIIKALVARAQAITVANGYTVDAGSSVFRDQENFDLDAPPYANVVKGKPQIIDNRGARIKFGQEFAIELIAPSDPNVAPVIEEALKGDLQKAMLDPSDRTLGGLCMDLSPIDIESGKVDGGATVTGAVLYINIEYVTHYGDPTQ